MFTTQRIANGTFATYWNGVETKYQIINGSLGLSGNGRNEYGFTDKETGKTKFVGTLQATKKTLELTLRKNPPVVDEWEPVSAEEQEAIIAAEVEVCRQRRAARI